MVGPPPDIDKVVSSQSKDKTNCPHCGRYVGPLELCPYCRRIHRKRLAVTVMKYSTPILGILGILLLRALGQAAGPTEVKIGDLGPKGNFAVVTVQGFLCDEIKDHGAWGSEGQGATTNNNMEFCVDDGTGRIDIKSYEDATRRINAAGKRPQPGDLITVTGVLYWKTTKRYLTVGAPEAIQLSKPPHAGNATAEELAWSDQGRFHDFDLVTVTGVVDRVHNEKGSKKATVKASFRLYGGERKDEETGFKKHVRVEIPWTTLEDLGALPRGATSWADMPPPGAKVAVTGILQNMGGRESLIWKVVLIKPQDVVLLESPPPGAAEKNAPAPTTTAEETP
jgi:hypothetical protein